jgi:hypothetical protein
MVWTRSQTKHFQNVNQQKQEQKNNIGSKKRKLDNVTTDRRLSPHNIILTDKVVEQKFKFPKLIDDKISKHDDQNTSIWNGLRTYIPANGWDGVHIDKHDWVSATKIKNYLINDPILDWLDTYRNKNNFIKSQNSLPVQKPQNNLQVLFDYGNEFEKKIFNYLEETYKEQYVQISYGYNDIVRENAEKTFMHMKIGTPLISQAVLINDANKTFGSADLLIRSDWINKLFINPQIDKSEETIKAPNLDGNYHYRVIDIKWTTLALRADGTHILNSDLFLAYKGQLLIYNCAVGELQGYFPPSAYILAKSWKFTKNGIPYKGNNCLELSGIIQYDDDKYDFEYIERTKKALEWVRRMRYYGSEWSCLPKPSVPELYPNMCNNRDEPHHGTKKMIAEHISELTSLWEIGYKNRLEGHKKGIFSWKDKRCCAKNLNVNGPKISVTLDKILEINRSSVQTITPAIIGKLKDTIFEDWDNEQSLDFYIDFETINDVFMQTEMDIFNSKTEGEIIFMAGLGFIENGEWKYVCFNMQNYSVDDEKELVNKMMDFIYEKVKIVNSNNNRMNLPKYRPRLFHWSPVEPTILEKTNIRHGEIWTNHLLNFQWFDLCAFFKSIPIIVNGALGGFSIKQIAPAMYSHGMISTKWDSSGPTDGFGAMMSARAYYLQKRKDLNSDKNYKEIVDYNYVDCKVMWEIITYLRINHTF